MSTHILFLDQSKGNDTTTIGGKASAVSQLRRAGFHVPDGFVLTTAAYPEFVAPLRARILARLTDAVINDPAEIEIAAQEIRDWMRAEPFSPALHAELTAALETLGAAKGGSFIARTSRPTDDLATSFGSGVARAYLGLVGAMELEGAAARCWAALWNSRAMYYRHRKKIVQTDVALAVLVQPTVLAESAGVMFTQSPTSGAVNEIQIKSIWGLGAPLTSARLRPDGFVVDKTSGEILERSIAEKVVMLVVGADGHVEEHGVAESLITAPSLADAQVKNLAALGQAIEQFFAAPQDIEWAIANGEIFILQARAMGIRNS